MNLFENLKPKRIRRNERKAIQTAKTSNEKLTIEKVPTLSNNNEQSKLISLLTPREHELFLILLEGYTLRESAKHLSIKYSTANTHITGIYKKLNVNSIAELIIRYRDIGKKSD